MERGANGTDDETESAGADHRTSGAREPTGRHDARGSGTGEPNEAESRLPFGRREFLAGTVSGALGSAAPTAAGARSRSRSDEGGSEPVDGVRAEAEAVQSSGSGTVAIPTLEATVINDVRYVDVAAGAEAVQAAVDEADGEGRNKVVVYGDEGEWNRTVLLPSEFTLEFRPGVTVTSSMDVGDADTFTVGNGMTAAALIRNADADGGNHDVTIRGGHVDFDGADTGGAVWAPVWLANCEDSRFEGITVENAHDRGGVMFTDCRDSVMRDCVARNIGYDGIALTLDCRRCDVYRCEASDCGGPGIQAATFGQGAGAPRDVNFVNCRTPEMIAFHGYPGPGGAQNVSVTGCAARRIGIIGEVTDFRVSDCDVDTVALSALGDTVRNGRVDSVTFGDRYDDPPAATILWALENGRIENVSFSNCTAHEQERFGETRLSSTASASYVDYTDCAFDGAGAATPRTFLEHDSAGECSNVRVQSGKVWNAGTVVQGPVDALRVRDTELHQVDSLTDGQASDVETRDNDWW